MSANSKIEWCDHTFNPWIGCTKISVGQYGGCEGCYAERSTPARVQGIQWGPGVERQRTSLGNWVLPRRWNAQHRAFYNLHGRRQRVFCASLADVFDNAVPVQWRVDLLTLIFSTPNLDWLLLTKRIGNVGPMLVEALPRVRHICGNGDNDDALQWPWPNVWLGATVVTQREADRDVPKLLAVSAAKHFLSMEPLLGPINLAEAISCEYCGGVGYTMYGPDEVACIGCEGHSIDPVVALGESGICQVIVGGESGPKARSMVLGHAKDIVRQCQEAGVAVFVKQLGARPVNREGVPHKISDRKGADMADWPEVLRVREFPA